MIALGGIIAYCAVMNGKDYLRVNDHWFFWDKQKLGYMLLHTEDEVPELEAAYVEHRKRTGWPDDGDRT